MCNSHVLYQCLDIGNTKDPKQIFATNSRMSINKCYLKTILKIKSKENGKDLVRR